MTFTKYPKMKDSGIEWIGEIPKEWNSIKLKFLTVDGNSITPGPFGSELKTSDYVDEGSKIYNQKDILDSSVDVDLFVSKEKFDKLSSFHVKSGDILLTSRGSIGKSKIIPEKYIPGIIHPCLIRVRIDEYQIKKSYVNLIINESTMFKENIRFNSNGTVIEVIYGKTLKEIIIPVPSLPEQKQIVSYLDKKTKTIDDEITKNQNLIKLLEEKKESEINRAVTKGLDDTVPMKDSGIEWIGEIPEEWNVTSLKHIGKLNSGGTPSTGVSAYWENGTIPWISSGEVNNNMIQKSEKKITNLGLIESSAKLFPKNSILIAITGEGATRGRTSILKIDATTNQSVVGIVLDSKKSYYFFLWYYIQSQYLNLRNSSHGSVQSGLNLNLLQNYPVVLQKISEQKQIVSYLDEKTTKIDSLISKIQLQISKLQEFRESLISSAVTGKICVTN